MKWLTFACIMIDRYSFKSYLIYELILHISLFLNVLTQICIPYNNYMVKI